MSTTPRTSPASTRSVWAWSFAVWTIVALFLSQKWYLSWQDQGGGLAWPQSLAYALGGCYIHALATPPLMSLGWRYRLERRRWAMHLVLQLLISVPVSAATFAADHLWSSELARAFAHPPSLFALTPFSVLAGFLEHLLVTWETLALSQGFLLYREARERALAAARLETDLARARLDALGMQLRPHFLFNTLNGVCALIRADPEAAERMIELLSDLLREFLKPMEEAEVTVREEIQLLERYLEIEAIRFGPRLEIDIAIDAAAEEARVPHLILHPLVENALRHGVARRSGKGTLRVAAQRRGDTIEIRVADNGPGFAAGRSGERHGLGLANTRSRLELMYGTAHQLEIQDQDGVQVRLTVPFRRKHEGVA